MSKFIKDWDELRQIPNESKTHILEVGEYNAWLRAKNKRENDIYLSTHTFYESNHEESTEILQSCGFDVVLGKWGEINCDEVGL